MNYDKYTTQPMNQRTSIQVVLASGFHLFPFRTEKLSPITSMILRNSGKVDSRRFIKLPSHLIVKGVFLLGKIEKYGVCM